VRRSPPPPLIQQKSRGKRVLPNRSPERIIQSGFRYWKLQRADANFRDVMVAFATNRIRWRTKMSNTRTAIGTLIAVLSLGATAIGSSPVYAKDHGVHSFRRHGIYAQATGQELLRAVTHGVTVGSEQRDHQPY
jgi:hypothetical protein